MQPTFRTLLWKTIVTHTVTYFGMGLFALFVFNYAAQYTESSLRLLMRPTTDPLVAAGPMLQPVRGLLFALAFYPLREILFGRKNGWLILWLLLVTLGIFSTFGPAPGSVEGLIYTTLAFGDQVNLSLVEVLAQSGLLAFILYYWINHPEKRWLTIVLLAVFVLVLVFSAMGVLFARPPA